jgi:hypothetical protein
MMSTRIYVAIIVTLAVVLIALATTVLLANDSNAEADNDGGFFAEVGSIFEDSDLIIGKVGWGACPGTMDEDTFCILALNGDVLMQLHDDDPRIRDYSPAS